jgi:hypothetical protein
MECSAQCEGDGRAAHHWRDKRSVGTEGGRDEEEGLALASG